ncbi:endoribonuclease Dicer [Galendromus occidentalis]|uniref:Endoribonuclease Dicer n=1 Tax=Galendromus occidentalis TaxID=34638 RepID=A0AAJ7SIL1_9ACAR|nr:endoribonuclease Dicer [Galendromus occidentalis]
MVPETIGHVICECNEAFFEEEEKMKRLGLDRDPSSRMIRYTKRLLQRTILLFLDNLGELPKSQQRNGLLLVPEMLLDSVADFQGQPIPSMGSSIRNDVAMARIEKDSLQLIEEQARSYQVELFEYAKKHNTIVCLGTGTGKTFISVLLIKYLEHQVTGPWLDESGRTPVGKRTIFLAPNVPLVEQQSAVLACHMTVKVGTYVGSMNTDRWTSEHWNKELQEHGVLVMTPEVCRIAVDHGFIPLENINLLVLDECHRATGVDPYVKIMENYKNLNANDRPRILGLTASVVNAQVSARFPSREKVRDLEACLFSTARTASHNVVRFGTKPVEIIVSHEDHDAEKVLPIDEEKVALLKDCADFAEFRKMIKNLAKTYVSCGAFCAKQLLEFRERELDKALNLPDCAEGFRDHAHVKRDIYKALNDFFGPKPSIHDVPPKMKTLLQIIKQFEGKTLSAVVFVQERLVAYVLYIWMTHLSREDEFSFVNCSFIVGQNQGAYGRDVDQESMKMNAKAQKKVMRDFRGGIYNLMFATSVIEEGMDVPACNLIVRFDPPMDVRSYTQSKGRARAKPSLYVLLSSESELAKTKALLDSYQETEQLVMHCCGIERSPPTASQSLEFLKEDPDLPPYVVEHARARITAQSAISVIHSYCQQFMRMKYPNVFPFFDFEETAGGYICTLTMPIVCPLREKVSNATRPFESKDKAKMFVALEMCKRLHACGELSDNLLPRRRLINFCKLPTKREDVKASEELRAVMVLNGVKSHQKKRYILPRKQAAILELREENIDCEPRDSYELYVIKTDVIAFASNLQNWRGEDLFDPSKYPTWLAIIMRSGSSELLSVPKFSIFTRSGEERVSFIDAGPIGLDDKLKKLCTRFNRYAFHVVLETIDEMVDLATNFHTPCLVPVKEVDNGGTFELDMDVLLALGPAKLPDFENFVFKEEDYEDAVVELLYHIDENQKKLSRDAHTKVPQDIYRRFYVTKPIATNEKGVALTPETTGYYGFNKSMSFADYALRKTLRAGPSKLLKAHQPVLTVEHAHKRLQMLYSRFENQQERRQNYVSDFGTKYLLPQFCAVHSIKASLWRKICSIPSILYRLNRLLTAETIRHEISVACRLKQPPTPSPEKWSPMEFKRGVKEKLIETPAREFGALVRQCQQDFDASNLRIPDVSQPDLRNCLGPSPCDIMKALTTKASQEVFDLERLELLGDSFLQIVATFSVLDRNPNMSISELNVLRQYEVNNRHLLCRAHDKKLTSVLEAYPFKATHNFLPLGCRPIPHEEKLLRRDILCLLVQCFDYDEDLTPKLKNLRHCKFIRRLLEKFAREQPSNLQEMASFEFLFQAKYAFLQDDQLPLRHDVPVRSFHDFKAKVGGDVVEALAGTYLEQCGPIGALRFFRWIGMDLGDTESNNFLDAFKLDFSAAQNIPAECLKSYQYLIEKVEKQIDFTFKSKGLVLQAITHHSCRDHLLTEDYNRLAFIGEAVADYLLTLYIYGLSSNLDPGQLSDLRSALINNQVTAYAVVRAELHTVLLYTNSKLFSAIRKYLENIDDIGLRLNTVLGDWETDDAEEAEVPRPLARILQSILGAVFIDSGKSFESVWRILVRIMGHEIALFSRNVPIPPTTELCKKFPGTVFSKAVPILEDEGKFEVKLTVSRNGKTETYSQIAENKKIAKTTLAKRYLRKVEREKKLEEIEELKRAHVTHESVHTLSDVLLNSEVQKSKFYRTRR